MPYVVVVAESFPPVFRLIVTVPHCWDTLSAIFRLSRVFVVPFPISLIILTGFKSCNSGANQRGS